MENEKKNDLMKETKELLNTPEGRFIKKCYEPAKKVGEKVGNAMSDIIDVVVDSLCKPKKN